MIISILGTAGRDRDTKEPVSIYYNCDILKKSSGSFCNSIDVLLSNYDDQFYFIGTQIAIDFQKNLLDFRGRNCQFIVIQDDSLDEIFEKILELLTHHDNIILDITHGFRHQPIMAIFASTLSQFLDRKELTIVYAKVIGNFESFKYISLNEYIEITQISLLLTGFIRTFNFIPVKNMKLLNNKIFENFSKSLLSNDIKGVEKNYEALQNELKKLQSNENLKHISNLISKVEDELSDLGMFEYLTHYQKYIILSKITMEKNYLIVSLAYIFESLREYCSYRFEPLCHDINFRTDYDKNTAVMNTMSFYKDLRVGGEIRDKYRGIYEKNRMQFKRVYKLYEKIRIQRNALAHINKTKEFENIKQDLNQVIFQVESLYRDEVLKKIRY